MAQTYRKIDSNAYSIGELLRKPITYRVPIYQRDFAWTIEQIDTLWGDITMAEEDNKSEYFLGAIVISHTEEDERRRDIIDGQQRLTAISMIFAAIAKKWRDFGDDRRSIGVFRDFLGSEDRRSGEVVSKMILNETNDPFFQSFVLRNETLNNLDRKTWFYTNKLLVDAYERIKEHIDDRLKEVNDKESSLLDLEEFLATNTNVIVIEAGDESDAFITFETLNDRGLDLAISDLVKNFLFSKAEANIEKFKKYWTEITLLVGGENMTQFLRYFYVAEYEPVRERDLYKSIRNLVKSKNPARQFVERLRKFADYYAALNNPEHVYWSDFPNNFRIYHEALLLFRVTQYRPVAMAAMDKFNPDQMTKLLRMLMVISFRYTIISSQNTGNLDRAYGKTASLISKSTSTVTLKDIFESLRSVYITDEQFTADFRQKQFTKDDIARYILAELNYHLSNDPEHTVPDRTGQVTLEHVYPKNPNDNWKGAIPNNRDPSEYTYLIGNLTLLERGKNRGIGNLSFEEKKKRAFLNSKLEINQDIASSDNWTHVEIEKRSLRFATFARSAWRLDY